MSVYWILLVTSLQHTVKCGALWFQSTVQLLSELSPKFFELARTDSLPHAFHGVKEERQIVMGQQHACQHLSGLIKMADECARMTTTNRAGAVLVQRLLIQSIAGVLDVQLAS